MIRRLPGKIAFVFMLVLAHAMTGFAQPSRFFFSGDGAIALEHARFDERVAVQYRDAGGHYDAAAVERIRSLFRSRENGAVGEVSLRLIELLDFIEDRFAPQRMVLVSGYRSPELNRGLRGAGGLVAKASLHTEGMAADVQPVGLNLRRLWIALRDLKVGGVGYYAKDGFLHIDTGRPRFWEPQTSRVGENIADGNARLFARTDFDRYDNLVGAVVSLHSVTVLPLRIARTARLGAGEVELEPLTDGIVLRDGCYDIAQPSELYRLRVVDGAAMPDRGQATLRLATCAPRVEQTPAEIESNAVERIGAE